jgi:WD40 repeat protein
VSQLLYTEIDGKDVLISGSADRTIKLWEPKNTKSNKCFQTIIGHQGSILNMIYMPMIETLISSSTDKTMKIWRIDKARQLLLYPRFIEYQKCNDLVSHKTSKGGFSKGSADTSAVWLTAFDYLVSSQIQLFACDSEGSLYVFESGDRRTEISKKEKEEKKD